MALSSRRGTDLLADLELLKLLKPPYRGSNQRDESDYGDIKPPTVRALQGIAIVSRWLSASTDIFDRF
jgi:hypothetical protein